MRNATAADVPVADRRLDAGEKGCGELLILVFKEMKRLRAGEVLEVIGHSTGALEDIPAWCRLTDNRLLRIEGSKPAHFFIEKGGA
jgi:tRNA 2-thiouridine synthesizing protein A